MITNHLIKHLNHSNKFKQIFLICLFTYIYLHLLLSLLYAYILIFVSFYDSFSCFNISVHAVLIIIRLINSLNLILRVY